MILVSRIFFIFLVLLTASACYARDETDLIALARQAVIAEVRGAQPPVAKGNDRAQPVFITIERGGRVLGCRGGLQARESTLQREIVRVARAAAQHDPRYRPLSTADLKQFLVTVTIVQSSVPLVASDIGSLLPEEGLVLQSGGRFGIVLPWEGREPRTRLTWAYRKAGIAQGQPCRLFRLNGQRFRG